MRLTLNPNSLSDYATFLRIKTLPVFRIRGRVAEFPDEYAATLGISTESPVEVGYTPSPFCFDYQRDITRLALRKRKFAVFADCGLGKTIIYFEYIRALLPLFSASNRGALILSPPMVVNQTIEEAAKFYGDSLPIEQVKSGDLNSWLATCGGKIGITNYEAFRNPLSRGQLGALIADESSVLKSHYGKYAQGVLDLGKGLEWKLAGTGTPAPNDRIEYANHAVFLDHFPTVNSFLARYFINRGQTQERWALKPHALGPFYRSLSHWCIFLTNPAVYGWKDNCEKIPPIHIHVETVEMTPEQRRAVQQHTGGLFASKVGGITKRAKLSQIAKGLDGTPTLKYDFVKSLVDSWPSESTIIWCWYNEEQDRVAAMFPNCANISGKTKYEKRLELIADFKAGRRKQLVTKGDILGFGQNLQIATRQVFSSLIDSYEQFYQCVKRSNRYGSTRPLNVHIPTMEAEIVMAENVLRKAKLIQQDTEQQEKVFRAASAGLSIDQIIEQEGIDVSMLVDG